MNVIARELRSHAPFTFFGTVTGVVLMLAIVISGVPRHVSELLFWTCHPLHVFLSAIVTTAMYRLQGNTGFWKTLVVGYFGSIGIATLSDSIIPYMAEILLDMPNRGIHLGVVEKWQLVNGLALAGIGVACLRPGTKFPHAGHVLISTWASLFHFTMAMGAKLGFIEGVFTAAFLFLAVWVPCCTSDIVFPLLFSGWPAK